MNAFRAGCVVELRGMHRLLPFLEEKSDGRLVILNKGPLARALQEEVGDAILTAVDGSARAVEIKIEEKHTGNLFLETWSNKNLDNRVDHAKYGSNPGWMCKVKADLLLYYFMNADNLYVFDMFNLKRWAFVDGRIYNHPEVRQGKRAQRNDTWGRKVPLTVLAEELKTPSWRDGYLLFHPKQYEFFPDNEPSLCGRSP